MVVLGGGAVSYERGTPVNFIIEIVLCEIVQGMGGGGGIDRTGAPILGLFPRKKSTRQSVGSGWSI